MPASTGICDLGVFILADVALYVIVPRGGYPQTAMQKDIAMNRARRSVAPLFLATAVLAAWSVCPVWADNTEQRDFEIRVDGKLTSNAALTFRQIPFPNNDLRCHMDMIAERIGVPVPHG